MKKRPSQRSLLLGDVIEIHSKKGYSYAQCTHRDKFYGPLLRIIPGFHKRPLLDLGALEFAIESYYVFLFWNKDIDHKIVHKVGRTRVPNRCLEFPLFKAGNADPKTGKVSTWWLWDGKKEWRVGSLTKQQKELPLCETWNFLLLLERIEANWHPRDAAK